MPGIHEPPDQKLLGKIRELERRLRAIETQQNFVIVDPRSEGNVGDPAHGNAVVVIGSLFLVGIESYGIASFYEGVWKQL
jgi:hypothetical protein